MSWDLTGKSISGLYYNNKYSGVITHTRVCYGGDVQYRVQLNTPITVYGDIREVIFVRKEEDSGNYEVSDE